MYLCGFVLLLLCCNVLCTRISEECVTYNFEENQKANFTSTYGICQAFSSWDVGDYSSLTIDSPHRDSTVFIKPKTSLSCISSFKFKITASGIFELNVFMKSADNTDQIALLVFQSLPGASDAAVGNVVLSPASSDFVPGWQTIRVSITGIGTFEGYITLLGTASESSTVLVDSFRYIGPTYDKNSCLIYDPVIEATTTTLPVTTPEEASTSTTAPPTQRPRLFVSILLIKIKKFFR